jgi:uncharacterized protein
MIIYILRFLLVLFILRLFFRFLSGIISGYRRPQASRGTPQTGIPLVRDRVCNTFLPRERAVRAHVFGREEYFCSAACRDRALSEARDSQPGSLPLTRPPLS